MTSPPLPGVSLRSGFAFCVTPQATAQDQPNRQRLHLAEPKRCLDEAGHLSGSLIHADETTINLQQEKGYVWVLASNSSVYFFYRQSRQGSFIGPMLRKFKGVLVSDFFTAYDTVDVPQQR